MEQSPPTNKNKNLKSEESSLGKKNPPANKKIISTNRNIKLFSSKKDMIFFNLYSPKFSL